MGQILHGSATTTHAVRAAIQRSKAPLKDLAARYGLNRKTVVKWRKRAFVHDAPMGPKSPRSTVLTVQEEATVVAFRRQTLLPLDDCLYALPGDNAASDPFVSTPLLATSRDQPSAGGRRRQAGQAAIQVLSHRLLPHRYRRGTD